MSVVNCKVQYLRPMGYKNLKEWMEKEDNIYIGRGGIVFIDHARFPQRASVFANPFKVGRDGTNEEVAVKYRTHIMNKIEKGEISLEELFALKGKNLGCWCYPRMCHGNILLELIEYYSV